ncbi:MAG: pyrroline-5-carboxylate reductase [Planctomycetota bacterium]
MSKPSKIAFIGAGSMATALARGLVDARIAEGGNAEGSPRLLASDAKPAAVEAFTSAVPGAIAAQSNADAADAADVLILAVKPQHVAPVLEDVADAAGDKTLVLSIAAGFPISRLAWGLTPGARIIRAMPNTPCLVGRGATAFSLGTHATRADAATANRLLSAVGVAYEVTEELLDAVTGLSGSGPAYVYTMIEAMSDAGVRAGLPRAVAADLAAQTVAGAARMVTETGEHPALLREAVTSPAGTTAAGLAALERGGLRAAIDDAVQAATARAAELGGKAPLGKPPHHSHLKQAREPGPAES